jgi:undecaprenyl diphosphate synthase
MPRVSSSSAAAAAAAAVFGFPDDGDSYYPLSDYNTYDPSSNAAAADRLHAAVGVWGYYHDSDDLHFFSNSENSSHQCAASAWEKLCCLAYCSDESLQEEDHHHRPPPLAWLVLRWMKLMLLKMIRSYHAKPFLLILAPLMLGLLVGFWIGERRGRRMQTARKGLDTNNVVGTAMRQLVTMAGTCCSIFHNVFQWIRYFAMRILLYRILPKHVTGRIVPSPPPNEDAEAATKPTTNSQHSNNCCDGIRAVQEDVPLQQREETVRTNLKSDRGTARESDVPISLVPKHVAVIMDGNRRYGKAKYGSSSRGHWDGSSKLVEFAKWCLAEHVQVLTVFAFSSENWNRDPAEVASLMQIFAQYCDELREEAIQQNIKIAVLSTNFEKIPAHVQTGVKRMVEETQHCDAMIMNICLSYGSRGEMVAATKSVVKDVLHNNLDPSAIDEDTLHRRLLTYTSGGDPDVLIRTSGEVRISNFLLWQLAYTELFFVDKPWPAMEKEDLLHVIRTYANGRDRRFGK